MYVFRETTSVQRPCDDEQGCIKPQAFFIQMRFKLRRRCCFGYKCCLCVTGVDPHQRSCAAAILCTTGVLKDELELDRKMSVCVKTWDRKAQFTDGFVLVHLRSITRCVFAEGQPGSWEGGGFISDLRAK